VQPPSTARLSEALRQVLEADTDQLPAITWAEHALRRYRDRVFLTAGEPPSLGEPREWCSALGAVLDLGPSLGRLEWVPRAGGLDPGRMPPLLDVRRRKGGESLRPERRGRTQTLKNLCQSFGILPWMRDALPLVYAGDDLVAVGDLWVDARWCVAPEAAGIGCQWRDAPLLA
jgi:tRNA(Ile)-lysidine synthase